MIENKGSYMENVEKHIKKQKKKDTVILIYDLLQAKPIQKIIKIIIINK